jgi:hypothetical protein
MTAGRLIFPGLMPVENADGDRIDGAKAYFYTDGTTTLANTYTDSGLSVLATNPVVADGVGVWPAMWADTATLFTVSITDSDGAPVPAATWSGVSAAIDATLASADLAASAQSAAEAAQAAAETAQAAAEAAEAQAEAIVAEASGAPFSATSVTELVVGTGNKSLTLVETGKLFSLGQAVVIAQTSAPATNQMSGVITAFDSALGTMTVNVGSVTGSGTHTDWTISLGATAGVDATRTITAAGLVTGGGNLSADRTLTVTAAVAADVRTGTSTTTAVTPAALVTAAAFVALTDAATVAWDVNDGFNAKVTLAGNRTIGAPTNVQDGITYTLDISQDATGSRVPSWNAIWDWGASGAPTLSTAANKKDKVIAQYSAASAKLEASFRRSA